MLYLSLLHIVSCLAYGFAELLKAYRDGNFDIDFPPEITDDVLERIKHESVDFRNFSGDGNGMSFNMVADILNRNMDIVKKIHATWESNFIERTVRKIEAVEDADLSSDSIFLETFRSINSKRQCVYGIFKDA